MSSEELDQTIDDSLHGTRAPNGIKELPDVFWLMSWADWVIEKQLIEEQHQESGSSFTPQAESHGANSNLRVPLTIFGE